MSTKIALSVRRPVCLSSQVKSFGEHAAIPMTKEDAYKAIASGAKVVAINEDDDSKTEVTLDNLDDIYPDEDESEDTKDNTNDEHKDLGDNDVQFPGL